MDNYSLFLKHEAEQEKWLKSRPICSSCKEPIQEDHLYRIDGKNYCESCIEERRESIDG
jgi:formylmethanofuran dehydrogenase subunit E